MRRLLANDQLPLLARALTGLIAIFWVTQASADGALAFAYNDIRFPAMVPAIVVDEPDAPSAIRAVNAKCSQVSPGSTCSIVLIFKDRCAAASVAVNKYFGIGTADTEEMAVNAASVLCKTVAPTSICLPASVACDGRPASSIETKLQRLRWKIQQNIFLTVGSVAGALVLAIAFLVFTLVRLRRRDRAYRETDTESPASK